MYIANTAVWDNLSFKGQGKYNHIVRYVILG